jgi:hypothetical protein
LPEKGRGVVNVECLNLDAASLSSAVILYLKIEGIGCRFRIFIARLAFAAHCVPLRASNWDTLDLRFGLSYGAFMAQRVRDQR